MTNYTFEDCQIYIAGERIDAVSLACREPTPKSERMAALSCKFEWTCGMGKAEWSRLVSALADRSHYRCRHRRRIVRKRQLSRMRRKDIRKTKRRQDSHRRCYNEVTIECSSFAYTDDGLELKGARFV